jgi:uncharacterized phiE125 gp8 family phage protein
MPLTRLTAIAGETILPLAQAKLHVRVTHDHEDGLIGSLRDAAISQVERVSGVALAESDWRWSTRAFCSRIDLPMEPATEVSEVTYHDEDGEAATYTGARLVDGSVYPAVGESWPSANGYAAVEFTAGLASPDDAPELLAAVKLLLAHFYENRGAVSVGDSATELPLGVRALIDTHLSILV